MGFDDRGKTKLSMKVVDQETGEDLTEKLAAERAARGEEPETDEPRRERAAASASAARRRRSRRRRPQPEPLAAAAAAAARAGTGPARADGRAGGVGWGSLEL
jgi:hypothetical protein